MAMGLKVGPAEKAGDMVFRNLFTIFVVIGFVFTLASGKASSEEYRGEENLAGGYESRIYGVVEKAPPGKVGNWVINKRDVTVTKETRFIEKHGKAVVGAYLEVEGKNTAMTFTASKIEVKRSKSE